VKGLAHASEDANSRIAAIKLLSKLALKLGNTLCEHFVAFEVISMADDPEQKVRKVTLENFINVCQMVSIEFFTKKLLPVYQRFLNEV